MSWVQSSVGSCVYAGQDDMSKSHPAEPHHGCIGINSVHNTLFGIGGSLKDQP